MLLIAFARAALAETVLPGSSDPRLHRYACCGCSRARRDRRSGPTAHERCASIVSGESRPAYENELARTLLEDSAAPAGDGARGAQAAAEATASGSRTRTAISGGPSARCSTWSKICARRARRWRRRSPSGRASWRRANAALEARNRELEEFVYIASHDLQEPLRTVAGYLQMIERRYAATLGPQGDEFIRFAIEGAQRMQALIESLLLYSRVATQHAYVRAGSRWTRRSTPRCKTSLCASKRPQRDDRARAAPSVHADRIQMVQLFQNLLSQRASSSRARARRASTWTRELAEAGLHGHGSRRGCRVRPEVRRSHLQDLSPTAPRHAGDGHRARRLQENRRAPRRHASSPLRARRRAPRFRSHLPSSSCAGGRLMIEILLVDDSEADVRLTDRGARERRRSRNTIHVAYDGESALEFLRRPGPAPARSDPARPQPAGMDGREVLAEIKGDPALAIIPVVILTTSRAEEDIVRTYQLHANCYITKPVDLNQFIRVVQSIEDFWFSVVRCSPRGAG